MSTQQSLLDGSDRIVDVDIAERMEQSFLDYSMSVIVGRALPDVRDGLKPVQRRILYAMAEAGLRPDRPHRKCAAVVGDVMKNYHPHGDSSIYEALVRMGQPFSTREPLVDGHGNFGSVDGDPPAAMRYTEARLAPIAMELLAGIDEDTVDFVPNYDGYETEPTVLPARFPNLLVNGSSGIAVGMATNIPPHNLGEVVAACLHLIKRPDATADDLMRFIPGPDFPTGARIVDGPGIRDAYLTGRGAITMEAVASTETRSGGLPRIVISEIPYQVNKAALLARIAELVDKRRLTAIRDLRDESSKDGMRVVIELKRGEDPATVLGTLYDLTDLRVNFNANVVALVDGQPQTLGLRDALVAYLAHQRTVLTRRTTHRRDKAAARAHILEGLLVALDHLDEVIALIRASATPDEARSELMARYALTEVQATAILDMPLRRLAALERQKIADEHRQLLALIAELEAILADPARLDGLLADELTALRTTHATPRRSRILGADAATDAAGDTGSDLAPGVVLEAQPITVSVSRGGFCKAVVQRRTSPASAHPKDPPAAVLRATSDDVVLLVDAAGGGYRIAAGDISVVPPRQRGVSVGQLLGSAPAAPIAGAVLLGPATSTVLTVSARGLVKRTERAEFEGRARTMVAAGTKPGDEIVAVLAAGDDDHLLLAHDGGLVIRFPLADVRPMGRTAAGVAGLKVPAGRRVVAASIASGGAEDGVEVLTLSADGSARRTPLAEYPAQGRGGKGVQTGVSALAWCGVAADLHVVSSEDATVLRPVTVEAGRRAGRLAPAVHPPTAPVVAEQVAPGGAE